MAPVFISYRKDSDTRCGLVRRLAEQLEASGLEVVLDQLAQDRQFRAGGPDNGWPQWGATQAGEATHRVLIVASSSWFKCYTGNEDSGVGLGATAEAAVIRQRLYNAGFNGKDIRIIVFDEADVTEIPLELQPYHRFALPKELAGLIHWLGGRRMPEVVEREDWPDRAPVIAWPMADHSRVRDAFAQLLTRDAVRYLSIQGPSETGKSHITRELLVNAMHIDSLACGRFDFKGTSDVESELAALVRNLDVPMPPLAATLNQRLSGVLTSLRQRGRPALMIFDTFEQAGEAAPWVRDQLLVSLIRAPYLRIVIAGKQVPERGGTTIRLTTPAPEDWHEYGRLHKPEIKLEFVRQVHEYCQGKPSVLAQLLGPGASQ